MILELSINKSIGGILLKSNNVYDKEEFFRVKQELENILGNERVLGNGISYNGYHPFGQEPLIYSIGDTIRGKDLKNIKTMIKDIEGLEIK